MADDKEAKMKLLDETMSAIEKTYGKGSIMKLGDGVINQIEAISTGSISLPKLISNALLCVGM